ncbi:type II toxin-antitoxin system VapC family toxin [archaeon]|jgi:predicted nucleic acid-binding protein|nr:type II toxin-antitoxin system VapC family toxin [archaeon]
MYVLDSSVFASIIVKDEFYEKAKNFTLKYSNLVTVDLAFVEVANVLWKHVYVFARIPEDKYKVLRDEVKSLILNTTEVIYKSTDLLKDSIDNAISYGITVYDSLYVTLALNTSSKFVSFDEDLKEKLKNQKLNIVLLP